jgi:KUP system potassium uptake protein
MGSITSNGGHSHSNHRLSAAGLLITIGIIFGDIGTSPLYVIKAIVGTAQVSEHLILGGFSCIFWTLTLQTTLKYVVLTLRADNNGEGGIFSLYALIRKKKSWLLFPAIVGGSTLLADGVITPSISISSAIEGLLVINPQIKTIPIVISILTLLFFVQQFGTGVIGRAFGPMMLIWFSMLLMLGLTYILRDPGVIRAFNPLYAVELLTRYPGGFWLLGAVFLCTTGAEALYSDLGHCGRANIRVSWIFVKIALLANYLGQSVYVLQNFEGMNLTINPFYGIMPDWFVVPGIFIATLAAIIASQSLISGSFTLISEAVLLNLWPKAQVLYPSDIKGQLYLPGLNWMLYAGCIAVVLYFRESHAMEAAYGLAITLTMLMTTVLLYQYLRQEAFHPIASAGIFLIYLAIELSFFVANSNKFIHGGWVTLVISSVLSLVMVIWYLAYLIKKKYTSFVSLNDHIPMLNALSVDSEVPKYATHLVYLTASDDPERIEWKTIYSILRKQPKRADLYWFIHVKIVDTPHNQQYRVKVVVPDNIVWVEFILGFRVQPRINLLFRKVVEELVKTKEVSITSRYKSLGKYQVAGDFRFVVLERYLSYGLEVPWSQKLILNAYFFIKRFTLSDAKSYGLDTANVTVEDIPLAIPTTRRIELERLPFESQCNSIEGPDDFNQRNLQVGAQTLS